MLKLQHSGNAKSNERINEVQTSSINPLNISVMEIKNSTPAIENLNEVQTTSSTNLLNISAMEYLNINFDSAEEPEEISNRPALARIHELAANGYYLVMQPKTSRRNEAYLWVKATKQGEDREEFALYVNNEILNAVIAVLIGKTVNISGINADDLDKFNQRIKNFEYVLFTTEKAQGRTMKKTYSTTGQTFSSYYKRGVITYKPYLNPELKAYLNA